MLKLGENIKKLRQEKDLTQEQLADIFGVSPQAVSRWENGATYPDITLLPMIANYFEVTLDDLMGMEEIRDESAIEEIFKEYKRNFSKGYVDKNIELLGAALKRYPKNEVLMFSYAASLASCAERDGCKLTDDEIRQNTLEAIKVDERLLEPCTDLSLRISTIKELSFYYSRIGEKGKAIKLADTLPNMWQTSTNMMHLLLTGEKQKKFLQETILSYVDAMWQAVCCMSDLGYTNEELTTEERIRMIEKMLRIFETVFEEDDYHFYSERITDMHRYIAAMDMLIGKHDDALEHLEAAAKYAIMNDTLPQKWTYRSLLLSGLEADLEDTSKNFTFTKCAELTDKLKWDRYDAIRDNDRFKAITEKISKYV